MRNMLIVLAVVAFIASSAYAGSYEYDREIVTVTATATNAATAVTETNTKVRGEIQEIFIDLATATTATVVIAVSPEVSTMTGYNLFSGGVSADTRLRPRFDGTDAAGAALTSDDPWPAVIVGDTITVTASGFDSTNKVVKVIIKYKK